jgi:hypothetical protein
MKACRGVDVLTEVSLTSAVVGDDCMDMLYTTYMTSFKSTGLFIFTIYLLKRGHFEPPGTYTDGWT